MKSGIERIGRVLSVNVSEKTGTSKAPVPRVVIDKTGVAGDAHAGQWHRQVSLLARESIDKFSREHNREFQHGEFAENITTEGLDLVNTALLDSFVLSRGVELEVTQIGKACHGDGCAIFQQVGRCVMPREGIFTRVIAGGDILPGDGISHVQRVLRIRVVTLSDRASAGIYEDKSGPRAVELVASFFAGKPWRTEISRTVLPDDVAPLRDELIAAGQSGADILITTGSTGIGPRDIAPDVVSALADKTIPGIMELVRMKYGADKPAVLLSRAVAAVMGGMLVYCVPGSVRAVEEYLAEILKTLEHSLFMIHGIDRH
jgi:molybdenum cofactor synthesis domain-containing protein